MEIIKLTAESTRTLPLCILDAEKRRKEAEQGTGKRYGVTLTLNCDE